MTELDFTGRRVFVTSDLHLGHGDMLRYALRPWLPPELLARVLGGERFAVPPELVAAHDLALVENINARVARGDVLLHLGDLALDRTAAYAFYGRLNCAADTYLLVGNHDDEALLHAVFGPGRVFERLRVRVGPDVAVCDHYPADAWDGSHRGTWHLYGHVHGVGEEERQRNQDWALSLDVGIDSHDYRPWCWETELRPRMAEAAARRGATYTASRMASCGKDQGGICPRGRRVAVAAMLAAGSGGGDSPVGV